MAHAHVCLRCGRDLARVRAHREPIHGWWIVRCPDCGAVAVRRRHPAGRLLRWGIRSSSAATGLAIRLGIGAGVVLGTAAAADHLQSDVLPLVGSGEAWDRFEPLALALPFLLGTWIVAGLGHLRPTRAWVGTLAAVMIAHAGLEFSLPRGVATPAGQLDRWLEAGARCLESAPGGLGATALLLPLMAIGGAAGLVLLQFGRGLRTRRFRWYRRLARRGRFVPG